MDLDDLFIEAARVPLYTNTLHRRMAFPAPKRMSVRGLFGYFHTQPWTEDEVQSYLSIGGWFVQGRHDFADRRAAVAAGLS